MTPAPWYTYGGYSPDCTLAALPCTGSRRPAAPTAPTSAPTQTRRAVALAASVNRMNRRAWPSLAAIGLILLSGGVALSLRWRVRAVSGVVYDERGRPVAGAVVRLRASQYATLADDQGRFALAGFPPEFRPRITAWADGYYVAGRAVWPWEREFTLTLPPYSVPDNASYSWIPPAVEDRNAWEEFVLHSRLDPAAALAPDALFFPAAEGLTLGCRDCHGEAVYDQWAGNAHALGFANPRFASMYNGTDVSGQLHSPLTRYGYSRDYGTFPLRPDPAQPYYGPGYKLDFPDTAGNCATCHLPAAALTEPYGTDPNLVSGVDALGSHCDFCHKIAAVRLNPDTGLPYENTPGSLSLEMMRPSAEKQIFFGPYDDVDAGSDAYLPLQRQSQFCAACHTASFWGVPIYQSFAEWLASPYSDPTTGQTCQDCHMKPDGMATNFAPERAGLERDPAEIFTHDFPGTASEELLQNTVTMTATAHLEGDALTVQVEIVNDRAGHHVPTDSPLRQMILLVRAEDGRGQALSLQEGSVVPEWGGVGDPAEGYCAGLPGKAFAKVLAEMWTEVSPTGAYWNPTRLASDNRLAAFAGDTSVYTFAAPDDGPATVKVTLLFRRAFKELMDQKGWNVPDVVMEQQTIQLR
jgi:Carboxypeptidase regulatory-like domain